MASIIPVRAMNIVELGERPKSKVRGKGREDFATYP
jgi:hypothetical protein